jgi:four helix bundle protein
MGVTSGDHKDLRAYQLARELARRLRAEVAGWPYLKQKEPGLQLIRAANSVGANIAEAMGRWHRLDQQRLLLIARGSVHELEHWIEVAQEDALLPSDAGDELPELMRTLNGLLRVRRT